MIKRVVLVCCLVVSFLSSCAINQTSLKQIKPELETTMGVARKIREEEAVLLPKLDPEARKHYEEIRHLWIQMCLHYVTMLEGLMWKK